MWLLGLSNLGFRVSRYLYMPRDRGSGVSGLARGPQPPGHCTPAWAGPSAGNKPSPMALGRGGYTTLHFNPPTAICVPAIVTATLRSYNQQYARTQGSARPPIRFSVSRNADERQIFVVRYSYEYIYIYTYNAGIYSYKLLLLCLPRLLLLLR